MTIPAAVAPQPVAAETFNIADPLPAGAATPSAGEQRQPCPECGEMIIVGAAKCRFCGAIFDPNLKKTGGRGNAELKQIAQYQKGLIFCILLQIIAGVLIGIANANAAVPRGARRTCRCWA